MSKRGPTLKQALTPSKYALLRLRLARVLADGELAMLVGADNVAEQNAEMQDHAVGVQRVLLELAAFRMLNQGRPMHPTKVFNYLGLGDTPTPRPWSY